MNHISILNRTDSEADDKYIESKSVALAEPKGILHGCGDASIIGNASFTVTAMLLAFHLMNIQGVSIPQLYVGNFFYFNFFWMTVTSLLCFLQGRTFDFAVWAIFAAYYGSYGAILTPSFGVTDAFSGAIGSLDPSVATLNRSIALFLFVWNGIFVLITLVGLRRPLTFLAMMVLVDISFFFIASMFLAKANLASGIITGQLVENLGMIAGVLMLLASLVGFYVTAAMFIELEWPCKLPRGDMTDFWLRFDEKWIAARNKRNE